MIRVFEKIMIALTVLTALTAVYLMTPFCKKYVSMTVMSIYSASCEKEALTRTEGVSVDIPGGGATKERDWYPFVMTFHAGDAFGAYIKKSASLTILYNFADFDESAGCSYLYDPDSRYYSSFYGAYLVKCADGSPYGFVTDSSGEIVGVNESEIAAVARFDYQKLVLRDFGLTGGQAVFDFSEYASEIGVPYAGSDGWYRIDAELTVNGCAHKSEDFTASYLQYGIPAFPTDKDLAPVGMYGRVYGKFIEEKKISVFFYVIAADPEALEECDRSILSKSALEIKTS